MTLCAVAIPTRLAGTTLLGSAENAATIRLFGWKCIQLHPTILVRFSTSWIGLSIGSETKLRNWTDSSLFLLDRKWRDFIWPRRPSSQKTCGSWLAVSRQGNGRLAWRAR